MFFACAVTAYRRTWESRPIFLSKPCARTESSAGFFSRDGSQGTVTVYDLQGAVLAHVTPPDGMQVYYPVSMLDDGRLLMVVGYDEEHDNRSRYAVMDADAFLNGSTEYTEMEFAG